MKGICPLFPAAVLLMGCATLSPVMRVDPQIAGVNRIAVFPLENISGEERAGARMTYVLLSALHNGGFVEVAESGDVEKFLIRNRIRSTGMISTAAANRLKDDLGCDAVMVGTVNEFSMMPSGRNNKEAPAIGLSVRLISTKDGRILWAISHSRHGADRQTAFGIGRVESLSELSEIVAADVLDLLSSAVSGRYRPPRSVSRRVRQGPEVVAAAAVPENGEVHAVTEEERERERQRIRKETLKLYEQIGGEQ